VFIEPLPAARVPTEGPSQQGAVNIYTRPMADQLVTVLGETPAITVKQIAESVALKVR
jgi:sigma-E factor negative regulatory protein RseB